MHATTNKSGIIDTRRVASGKCNMTLFTAASPFHFVQDVLRRVTLKLAWGPSTDPNKLAPPMAQYDSAPEWPDWCRVSFHGAHLVRVAFLDSLPRFMEGKHDCSILDEVDNIRLRQLSHYKCDTDWNHEFVRADLFDERKNRPLIMVWERDLPLTSAKVEKQRGLKIKSGFPCRSVDRVSYLTEGDFSDFLKLKGADLVRTADFPAPGPDILQVASVLEIHSLSFPMYHIYSTMCYWYADSTFEVLAEIGKAKVRADGKLSQKKGVFRWGNVDCVAYSGVTRRSLIETGKMTSDPTRVDEDDVYCQELIKIQDELVAKYDSTRGKAGSKEELAQLPEAERRAIEQNGWNVTHYLSTIQKMPTHQKLLDDSTAREREVREALREIQSGQEAQDAATKREAEAKQCAEVERVMAEQEEKWKDAVSDATARLQRAEREREQERQRADSAETRADSAEIRAEQERVRADNLAAELTKLKLQVAA
ncbi:hypothetical protein B0J18DRAFT_438972 [Chaetomium sp. MPI-SDFR-AT-0129]|nr:hypothetical protein B0J18DRAFT_438972 [Chaetomium sp. MPI-SDFR-AT-0129]